MAKYPKCPKCGYQRKPEDDDFVSKEECPKCGVFYARVEKNEDAGIENFFKNNILGPDRPEVDKNEKKAPSKPHAQVALENTSKLIECAVCAKQISANATVCPHCGEPLRKSEVTLHSRVKQFLGVIGSAILIAGVFSPIIYIPAIGSVDYFRNGESDGAKIILALAVIGFVLALSKKYKGLWYVGSGSLIVSVISFVFLQTHMMEIKQKMDAELAGNPFRGFADMAMQSVHFQWGWAVLIIGAVLILLSAGLKSENL